MSTTERNTVKWMCGIVITAVIFLAGLETKNVMAQATRDDKQDIKIEKNAELKDTIYKMQTDIAVIREQTRKGTND